MTRKNQTTLALSAAARAMARMAAGRDHLTLAEYIERLIREDAQRSGIADLISDHGQSEETDDAQ